ncbi:hypothetical protein FOFC_17482 [Fusarium oxysporum]|nr:hypothetical protein FOFC_17482 [Fusarium oxysporum]
MTGETGPITASLPVDMTIAGFFAIACYNCVEILISLLNRFRRHDSLYFWSIVVATLGIVLHSIVVLLRYYSLGPNFPLAALTCVGWYGMVTGQSVVLYSRLHLIVSDRAKTRWVLVMIITDFFILHVPVTVMFLGSNTRQSSRFLPAFNLYERIQLAGFSIQETIISGLYIWEASRGLKPIFAIRRTTERKVIRHLIIVNVLVVLLDVSLIITQYLDHFQIATTYKPPITSGFFFPIGSVPTRSMIAFFRDRDPAGRSEPEGMESTSPSTNDVDVLSSSTLAVASLTTPAPSLQEETPHEEVEHQYLWRCFPDYVWSQRVRDTPSWVWGFGYDVEDSSGGRRWVCRRCIQNKNPKPRSFAEKGIQNANAHLFKGHGIRAPPDKTKSAAEKKAEKLKAKDQRSIAEVMKLDTRLPREQDIANSLVKGFDRKHFQRLLLEWIIEENHAFSVCEQGRLRQIFEYLNPLVKITDANITRTTIRRKVLSAYEMHKDKVVAALKQSCGLIHVSFDGWKSGNRHSLYGIACFFRDENSQSRKLALGVPELRTRHFGHNIAAEILDVLDAYGIQDKIGYFTLDNAESNDKAMEVIGGELGFVGSRRRGRCFGHTLNLSAKALLFGHNVEVFEEQLSGEAALSEAEHTLWRRKGPVGKLHNLVVDVRRSDQLTYLLRGIQRSEFDLSSDPRIRARQPVDLIIDNDTRWLSQLYMIRRAIILRPFIEQLVLKHRQQWEQDNRSKRTGNLRKSAREPRICLEENQLTVNDWVVLEHLAKLLGFYEDAVKTLEGDGQQRKRKGGWVGSYGNVWEVIQGFEFLLEVLEDYKQLASEIPDAEHFRINVNLGWEKLNKYYSRLDETPIYYTALALHPAFRWGYFENEWKDNTKWVMKAKQMVREVWESNYRHLQVRTVSARGRFSDTVW